MLAGIDSYSYHRRYGEIRPGEVAPRGEVWPADPRPVLEHADAVGAEIVFLETCYLPEPETITAESLDARAQVAFSWGHPWPNRFHGLEGGRSWAAEQELARWIEASSRLGHDALRITLGSPMSRGDEPAEVLVERLVGPVRRAADLASRRGVRLAIENHGDLRAADIIDLLDRVNRGPVVGVCLDNVNLVRVGDDMAEGTRALAPHAILVQLKDHAAGEIAVPGGPVCTALGEGVADLDGLLAILSTAGFDGAVCVELASLGSTDVDELGMVGRSVAWLRQRLAGLDAPAARGWALPPPS